MEERVAMRARRFGPEVPPKPTNAPLVPASTSSVPLATALSKSGRIIINMKISKLIVNRSI
jgi:hypothetical protein